jgi:hypothetical protein
VLKNLEIVATVNRLSMAARRQLVDNRPVLDEAATGSVSQHYL